MKIEHIAIWTNDLERLREFYIKFFRANANEKYINPGKNFSSYFLSFDNGCRLEIMHQSGISESNDPFDQFIGLAHFAVSTGSKQAVDELTERLRHDNYKVIGEPRTTGDGYYESVVLDPDGNRIEITI